MIYKLIQLVILLAAALPLLVAIWLRPVWAALAVTVTAAVLDCFEVGVAGLDVGVNVYVDDVASLVLLLTGVLVLVRYPEGISRDALPCLLLLALVALNFGRGAGDFGLKQAGNNVRNVLCFLVPALSIMLLRPIIKLEPARLARLVIWTGYGFCAVAILRWSGLLPMALGLQVQGDGHEVQRTLNSDNALVIGQAFIGAIYFLTVERRRLWFWWASAGMFGLVTLGLQHRSVWSATAAGAAWLIVRSGRISPLRWIAFGATAVLALGLVVVANPAIMESATRILSSDLSETQSDHSTWSWRVDGFIEATDRTFAGEAIDMLVGPPAGWLANSGGSFASIHIHSHYFEALASSGVIGTASLIVWLVLVSWRTRRPASRGSDIQPVSRSSSAFLQAMLFSLLVYFVAYTGGMLQAVILSLIWIGASQCVFSPGGQRRSPIGVRGKGAAEFELQMSHQ